jgi:hypothetical protein
MSRAGNLDRYLTFAQGIIGLVEAVAWRVGKFASLPTASETYRGAMARTEGAAGVADTLRFLRKTTADAYEWATVIVGSAPTFTDFTNAQHDHLDADDGGTLTINALSDVGGITAILTGTNTWDIGNTANGGVVSRTVTVTGAVTGDPCCAGLTTLPVNWEINCQVSGTDTATVIAINRTGGNSDPGSGTVRATVFQY